MNWFERHYSMLEQALSAIGTRGCWSPFAEIPSGKFYGETAKQDGEAAFQKRLNAVFTLSHHPQTSVPQQNIGQETSPYGLALNITYPQVSVKDLLAACAVAAPKWSEAHVTERVGVCLEILHRLNQHSFELAHAVMHTSGQAFPMAFQAGGPHAQDRGLEAVAYAYAEMVRIPEQVLWEKPQGKNPPVILKKKYKIIPRGAALVIGCNTFPTWNSYPGLFASLVCGNPVIVKPHPAAILPLAISLEIGRAVLSEAGFDPNLLLLAADSPGAEITCELAADPAIQIIDFTGSSNFANWLRSHTGHGVQLYTEEAGVNSIVITGTDDFKGMCANIAFSLSLYSGQMCTAPQTLYVPRAGIGTDEGHKDFDAVADAIAQAVDQLLADPTRALAICGAIANPATLVRLDQTAALGKIVRPSAPIEGQSKARTATPLILKIDQAASNTAQQEYFGPISFIVPTDDATAAITTASVCAMEKGAITAGLYATDPALLTQGEQAFAKAGVTLSCNLTGSIYVNQNAAFSDYHVSGANPSGNACLTDTAYVANRFRIAASRHPHRA